MRVSSFNLDEMLDSVALSEMKEKESRHLKGKCIGCFIFVSCHSIIVKVLIKISLEPPCLFVKVQFIR